MKKNPLADKIEKMADEFDSKDYSHCSDSGIKIGFKLGWTSCLAEMEKEAEKELSRYKTALSFMISCARSGETNFDLSLQLILNQEEEAYQELPGV